MLARLEQCRTAAMGNMSPVAATNMPQNNCDSLCPGMLLPNLGGLSHVGAPPATIQGKRRSGNHEASADPFPSGGAQGRFVTTHLGENSSHKSRLEAERLQR